MKVALKQRISKLEKKVGSQVRAGPLEGQSLYQPSEADLADAVAILVECGAVRKAEADITAPLETGAKLGYCHCPGYWSV